MALEGRPGLGGAKSSLEKAQWGPLPVLRFGRLYGWPSRRGVTLSVFSARMSRSKVTCNASGCPCCCPSAHHQFLVPINFECSPLKQCKK